MLQEAAIMAQFSHPHIIGLLGVVTIGEPTLVIIEYCEHGSLEGYLRKNDLPALTKHMLTADCADGLAYLASCNFVHRDVAARNVLVSTERRAKISDFGMSRETKIDAAYVGKNGQFPVRWTAPEALEEFKFTTQSDVWSFGVLMYEIWTKAAVPYEGLTNQKVWVEVLAGYRLPCPDNCPTVVHDLMVDCWKPYGERPSFEVLMTTLREWASGAQLISPIPRGNTISGTLDQPYVEFMTAETKKRASKDFVPYDNVILSQVSYITPVNDYANEPELNRRESIFSQSGEDQLPTESDTDTSTFTAVGQGMYLNPVFDTSVQNAPELGPADC